MNKDNSLPLSKRPRTTGAKRKSQGDEVLKIEKNIEETVLAASRPDRDYSAQTFRQGTFRHRRLCGGTFRRLDF